MKKPSIFKVFALRLAGKDFVYESFLKIGKVLDVGCGEGEFLWRDPKNIMGLDLNKEAVERIKSKGGNAILGSATKLPFADSSFEGVHSRNIIEHMNVEDALSMLKEMSRVVKPNGMIVVASEVVTKKFWQTFGHVKPYPPEAIIKLTRSKSREAFEGLQGMETVCVIYLGEYFRNKFLYALSVAIAYYLPFLRREYFLVMRKK